MEEALVYRGEWWVPAAEHRWPGRFSYTRDGGIRLEVDARLEDGLFPPPDDSFPILFGETTDGKAVTLLDSIQVQTRTTLGRGVEATFAPTYTFIGAWFESRDDLMFECLTMRLSDVDRWLNVSGFRFEFRSSPPVGFRFDYQVPDTAHLGHAGGIRVDADFSAKGPSITRPQIGVEVRQRARVRLEGPEDGHFDDLLALALQTRNFFSFVVRRSVQMHELTGRVQVEVRHADGTSERKPKEITVLFEEGLDVAYREPVEQFHMLFLNGEGPGGSESALSQWLGKREHLAPIYDLYLVGLYQPRTYLHVRFLSLTQALESLHARKFPHYELSAAEHQAWLDRVTEAAPEEDRPRLSEKLAQSNKATFRQSLADLIETLPPSAREPIGDVETFTQLVGWTRNYHTHWDPRLESKAAKGEALFRLTAALKLMVEALLLLEIGFSEDDADALLRRNPKVRAELALAFSDV